MACANVVYFLSSGLWAADRHIARTEQHIVWRSRPVPSWPDKEITKSTIGNRMMKLCSRPPSRVLAFPNLGFHDLRGLQETILPAPRRAGSRSWGAEDPGDMARREGSGDDIVAPPREVRGREDCLRASGRGTLKLAPRNWRHDEDLLPIRSPGSTTHGKRLIFAGAAEGIRTPDPRITNALLYQLSYRGPAANQ
jgi:hypothetical protein